MRKTVFLLLLMLCIGKAEAQDIGYNMPRPLKWGVEKLSFPIDFAPKIPYAGDEELRFAPGWNDSKSNEYWAYVYLWFIRGKVKMSEELLNSYLTQYYNGLYLSNLKDKTKKAPSDFTSADVKSIHHLLNDAETYEGQIITFDFLTGKAITFNARIHLRNYPQSNRTALLFEIAPQDYRQPVWIMMNNIVAGFTVQDNNYY